MLREKIQAEIVTAMKAKDKERIAALRLIGAKIKDRDIELRTSDKKPEDDAMVTDVLLKMAKQRRDATIEEFLPKQMSEEETKAAIADIKAETGAEGMKDMGKVMGELKARHGATLDMTRASGWVKEALS